MTLKNLQQRLNKQFQNNVTAQQKGSSILLEGSLEHWQDVLDCGKAAARIKGIQGVINNIVCRKQKAAETPPEKQRHDFKPEQTDVLIIGGGIIGCTIARELSKWDIDITLIEKESDVAVHASSRNDGMIHPGLVPSPGTAKAKYNAKGNAMYETLSKELDFEYNRVGSLLLFENPLMSALYPILAARARKNKVNGIHFVGKKGIGQFLKNSPETAAWAIHLPSTGIVSPYKTTIAFCENAIQNGLTLHLNTKVLGFEKENNRLISCQTNRGTIHAKVVINCAGTASDEVAEMAGDRFFTIHPRKGTILIIDKKKGKLTDRVLSMPKLLGDSETKGGGIVPTVEGNLLVGPDAVEQPEKEDYSTEMAGITAIANKHFGLLDGLSQQDIITYFSGTRASTYLEDFIVGWSHTLDNLFHVAGIQSPGLASAPAIAEDVAKKVSNKMIREYGIKKKPNWQKKRTGIINLVQMPIEEREKMILQDPSYGDIICRCEEISKGEIRDALKSPIPVASVDAVKRRVRAGMGRCQGGFCKPLVMTIIAEELGKNYIEIEKDGPGSRILMKETKNQGDRHA